MQCERVEKLRGVVKLCGIAAASFLPVCGGQLARPCHQPVALPGSLRRPSPLAWCNCSLRRLPASQTSGESDFSPWAPATRTMWAQHRCRFLPKNFSYLGYPSVTPTLGTYEKCSLSTDALLLSVATMCAPSLTPTVTHIWPLLPLHGIPVSSMWTWSHPAGADPKKEGTICNAHFFSLEVESQI